MALPVRPAGLWLVAAVLAAATMPVCAQTLSVRFDGGSLRAASPPFHFLAGRPLESLHNGASVIFAVQLTLRAGSESRVLQRAGQRFAVSYDLWEEKFAVTRLGKPPQSITHLSAAAAEAWCTASLAVPATGLSRDTPFRLRLEVRAEEGGGSSGDEEESSSLTRLVELFSRPPRKEQPRWQADSGLLRLRDL